MKWLKWGNQKQGLILTLGRINPQAMWASRLVIWKSTDQCQEIRIIRGRSLNSISHIRTLKKVASPHIWEPALVFRILSKSRIRSISGRKVTVRLVWIKEIQVQGKVFKLRIKFSKTLSLSALKILIAQSWSKRHQGTSSKILTRFPSNCL
jgi:hypothetical protein